MTMKQEIRSRRKKRGIVSAMPRADGARVSKLSVTNKKSTILELLESVEASPNETNAGMISLLMKPAWPTLGSSACM